MKKIILSLAVAFLTFGSAMAKGQKDPVLMTVDKKPVTMSEFNYLYQKNNSQQVESQPIKDYLDMFVVYKLKVADAENDGIQNTDQFKNEYNGYKRDLAQPYLTDPDATEKLVAEFYDRLGKEVNVSHIMVDRKYGTAEAASQRHLLDSLRNVIISGKSTFADVADRYSIDPSVKRNHGNLGWISAGRFPYSFETKAYETPVGEISEVFETPFGYHILTVLNRRDNPGEVLTQHILKVTKGLSAEEQAMKKNQIDSIASLLAAGADFDELAKKESEDPGSGQRGGRLPWFGTGRMVPEFETMAFSLKDGETSAPFRSDYGWHIVKRLESRGLEPLSELRPSIEAFIERDDRNSVPLQAKKAQLRKKYNVTTDSKILDEIKAQIANAGTVDSAFVATLKADNRTLIKIDRPGTPLSVSDVLSSLPAGNIPADMALTAVDELIEVAAGDAATDAERENLVNENNEYRNLLNEYRDGMLLFEISDRNVWSKAKNDIEGLNAFFNEHKADYTNWTAPKFKGLVIFTTSDSIADEAKKFLASNPLERQDVAGVLMSRFGQKNVKVERVIAAKGENPIIDYLAFDGEKANPTGKWVACFTYLGEVIDQPQEPDDVRGQVTTDYQNYLEQKWVEQLRKKYKVKIDKKILREVEAQQPMPISR